MSKAQLLKHFSFSGAESVTHSACGVSDNGPKETKNRQ